jgi:hypothetical protein
VSLRIYTLYVLFGICLLKRFDDRNYPGIKYVKLPTSGLISLICSRSRQIGNSQLYLIIHEGTKIVNFLGGLIQIKKNGSSEARAEWQFKTLIINT